MRKVVSEYADDSMNSLEFIKGEYLSFYKTIEYKFAGVFKVDKAFITKLAVT